MSALTTCAHTGRACDLGQESQNRRFTMDENPRMGTEPPRGMETCENASLQLGLSRRVGTYTAGIMSKATTTGVTVTTTAVPSLYAVAINIDYDTK